MDIAEIRRTNLVIVLARFKTKYKTQEAFAEAVDTAASYLSQLKKGFSPAGVKNSMGDDLARRIEQVLGLPHGWMDSPQSSEGLTIKTKIDQKLSARLTILRKSKKLTHEEIAKQLEQSVEVIASWENGTVTPSDDELLSLSTLYGVNADFLDPNRKNQKHKTPINNSLSNVEKVDIYRSLPVLTWVQAGNWSQSQSISLEDVTEYLPSFNNCGPNSFYLKVKGISNFPTYMEGDYICVDPNYFIDQLETGEMVVVSCNDEATFKMLVVEGDNRRYLKALNESWTPNIIELNEDCMLVGVVVDSYRPNRRPRPNLRKI